MCVILSIVKTRESSIFVPQHAYVSRYVMAEPNKQAKQNVKTFGTTANSTKAYSI